MSSFSHAVNYPAGTLGAHARKFVSVKDKPFNAAGNGVTDDSDAIEAAFASGATEINFPAGVYLIGRDLTRPASVVIIMEPGVNIIGGHILSSGVALGDEIPTKRIFGRLEIRDRDVDTLWGNGFETDPYMGQVLRLDCEAEPGQCAVYLSSDQREPVIGSMHYVGIHSRHNNSVKTPNVWGYNPVMVKNTKTTDVATGKAGMLGVEISLSNNTDEAGMPLVSGELSGLFVSYIHVKNRASAAVETGGLSAGFNNLLWLDGVATDGTHITLRDEVSANGGAKRGLDTSAVSKFTDAAILLGNNHSVAGRRSDTGKVIPIAQLNTSNQIAIGDASHTIKMLGPTILDKGGLVLGHSKTTKSYIDFHSSGNNNNYDARFYVAGGNAADGNANMRIIASSVVFTGTILHYVDNTHSFGGPSNRATQVYAANNTINTSDEREKSVPIQISDKLLDAWAQVEYVQFKWLDAIEKKGLDDARWHFGVIAQRVKETFEAAGLDPFAYGVLCRDEWEEQEEIVETWGDEYEDVIVEPAEYEYFPATYVSKAWRKTVKEAVIERRLVRKAGDRIVQPYRAAGYRFGIRYEQALILEAALMRRTTQRLEARLAALEAL